MRGARRPHNVLRGIVLLARGRALGLQEFAATREAFLASLAPLIAFPLVGAGLTVAAGEPGVGIAGFLATLCALLGPPVLSETLATRWGRGAAWLGYAVAFNWSQWAVLLAASLLMVGAALAVGFGVPGNVAGAGMLAFLLGYGLWLHWFLAVHALGLGVGRAVLLVVVVNVGTGILVLGPHFVLAAAGYAAAPSGGD